MRHSEDYERKPAREWTASRTRNTNGTSRETSKLSTRGSRMASIRRNLCAESISPRRTGSRDQSRFLPWRIRSCRRAMVEILNAIYEEDFLDCSDGFRPGRGQHQALDGVGRVICTRPTGWVLEIDVTAYFDSIVREQLMEMIEKRVRDRSVLRLIRKWIQVGVIEDGRLLVSETGTGQGQTISPLLANIYLHHVLDEWFEHEVKPRLRGAAHEIRFADDAVLCFQYKNDAERVMGVLSKRFAKYGLTLHPEKTRLLEFGRYSE